MWWHYYSVTHLLYIDSELLDDNDFMFNSISVDSSVWHIVSTTIIESSSLCLIMTILDGQL